MKNDFQDAGMRQRRITVSGRWETRSPGVAAVSALWEFSSRGEGGSVQVEHASLSSGDRAEDSVRPKEMAGRAAYNTREERDALRESLEDLQRVHPESSAEYWSLHTYEKIVKTREKNHPKALQGTVTVSNRQIRKCNSQDIGYSTQDDLASKVGK